jgi:hypothetical protein
MPISIAELTILGNPDVLPAFEKLTDMVSHEGAIRMFGGINPYLSVLKEQGISTMEFLPVGTAAPLMLALLHCTMGTPLFLNDPLLEAWERTDGTVTECSRCGYRVPAGQGFATCVVCGSRTGEPGCWARNKGRVATSN